MSDYSIAIKIGGQIESSFNSSVQIAMNGLSALGAASVAGMTAAARGIEAIGRSSVQVGKDFETAMSSASATASASEEDFFKMKQAAMEMGKTTSKTATESAQALEYMALAGWDVDTSISALPSVLKMSEASGMELGRTSDLVTDSMAALGVSVNELPNYLDVVTKAQNKSNQTAEQLMEAYLGVGGTMKNLNVPIAESATALGVLANRGIKGSEAGNALNAVMVNLTTGTGQAGKMMQEMGISAFDSQGNFIGLEATLQQLNTSLQGCSEEERNAALAAIGGKQHVDALNNLMAGLNTTNEQGISEWAALTNELENCNGSLDAMRDTKLDNLEGDLKVLQSAAEDAGIKIYENLNEPLRGLTQYGTQAIYTISDALQSGGFSGMAEAIGSVLADGLADLAAQAPQFVDAAAGMVMSFITGIENHSGDIAQSFADLIVTGIDAVFQIIPQMFLAGVRLMAELALGIADQLPDLIASGVQAVAGFVQGISECIPVVVSAVLALMQALLSGIAENASILINAAVQLVGDFIIGIVQALPQVLEMGMTFVMELTNGIMASLPFLLQTLTQVVVEAVAALGQMIPQFIDMGIAAITNLLQGIIANLGNIAQAAIQIATALFTGLVQAIPHIITAIPRLTDAIVDTLANADWVGIGLQIIHAVVSGIIHGVAALLSAIPAIAKALGEVILKANPIYIGFRFIKAVITGIINGILSLGGLIWDAFKGLLFRGGKNTGAEEAGASMVQDYAAGADSQNADSSAGTTPLPADSTAVQAETVQAPSAPDHAADTAAVAETAAADGGAVMAKTEQAASGVPADTLPAEETAAVETGTPAVADAVPAVQTATSTENTPMEGAAADSAQVPPDVVADIAAAEQASSETATDMSTEAVQMEAKPPSEAITDIGQAGGTPDVTPPVSDIPPDAAPPVSDIPPDAAPPVSDIPPDTAPPVPKPVLDPPKPDTPTSSSAIGDALDSLSGKNAGEDAPETGAQPSFTYSPVFNIEGSGDVKEDVEEANRMGMREFEELMEAYLKKNKRVKFG